jgi:hypothetical protein
MAPVQVITGAGLDDARNAVPSPAGREGWRAGCYGLGNAEGGGRRLRRLSGAFRANSGRPLNHEDRIFTRWLITRGNRGPGYRHGNDRLDADRQAEKPTEPNRNIAGQ